MKLSFAWWNTALSPSGKPRANDEQKAFSLGLINKLLAEFEIDFIALGEVCDEDVRYFSQGLIDGFVIQAVTFDSNSIKFHTCFIWREEKIIVTDAKERVLLKNKQSFRLAQRLELAIIGTEDKICLFVSHWPSRLYCQSNHPIRHDLGLRLRDAIDEALEMTQYIMLMGDYNDEPFDASLSEHLQATRDKAFAQRRRQLLYNPFWRHMIRPLAIERTAGDIIAAGSYYHKQGDITRWRTFDQIIFSSAFLNNTLWCLNEESTGIINIPEYCVKVTKAKEIFDHMPVMGVIERGG